MHTIRQWIPLASFLLMQCLQDGVVRRNLACPNCWENTFIMPLGSVGVFIIQNMTHEEMLRYKGDSPI